jgi:hypothetical protein
MSSEVALRNLCEHATISKPLNQSSEAGKQMHVRVCRNGGLGANLLPVSRQGVFWCPIGSS